ncbi:putative flagellin with Flp1-like domain [Herbinix hemicellulosilytica]|uniref:Putative membrane protein n=1 Tax=Herbinix hemicellulosilytica TaxID=1564487 RepID=A0A0H5SLS5_HERHM|nr:Flp1 family type IVb pilin [Herbinix hemicellulosilytica]RBP57893.1 putative flagellin with Flp1-like domain [Herbinix hemicellulosilytica]CRZ35741.1 putative membrane protein [Herbinix hemicellulosilytica]
MQERIRDMTNKFRRFMSAEASGIGVVEIILIIVVLIGLVIIFRDNIQEVIQTLFDRIGEAITEV